MKSQRTLIYFFLGLLIYSSTSCKTESEEPQLPAETKVGKNTFGCKVNGEIWLPQKDLDFKSSSDAAGVSLWKTRGLFIKAGREKGESYSSIELRFEAIKKHYLGSMIINSGKVNLNDGNYFLFENNSRATRYYTDSLHTGSITFTRFDTVAKIISGKFEFEAIEQGGEATVKVTDGRFDFKYQDRE